MCDHMQTGDANAFSTLSLVPFEKLVCETALVFHPFATHHSTVWRHVHTVHETQ